MTPSIASRARLTRLLRLVLLGCVACASTGCALVSTVQPWEKGALARPEMRIDGDPLEARFNEHIYASREAASGGTSVGGGGCGCN